MSFIWKYSFEAFVKETVLLVDRKRRTVRRVASTRSPVGEVLYPGWTWGGGGFTPVLARGGGTLSWQEWGYSYSSSGYPVLGYPPTPDNTWDRTSDRTRSTPLPLNRTWNRTSDDRTGGTPHPMDGQTPVKT